MRPVSNACEAALQLLPPGLLVGVSGGVDSVALLHALTRTGQRPTVVHFDHGWRVESKAETALVKALAARYDLPLISARASQTGAKKTEATARTARYAFFTRAAKRLGFGHIVLAHHADDQVETFLMQLLRGTGSDGRGMEPMTARGELVIHRPWLGLWRYEILAYARRQKLTWSEDATNADIRFRRNLMRHRVLPYLRRHVSPRAGENLWRSAEILRAEGAWMDALCAETAARPELEVKTLRSTGTAQQRRTILRWLQQRGVRELGFAVVEAVRALLTEDTPAKINLPGGKFARRRAGRIFLEG